jgi:hypothetical protein
VICLGKSKLAAAGWANDEVAIPGLEHTSDDACYRAMDWLLEIQAALEREVFAQVANLLNLEVDLLFFDTTSTYFELEEPDTPIARDPRGCPCRRPATATVKVMMTVRTPRGSAATATPKTTATTCRRSWSAWRSPARGSRSGCGAGPATPATKR